MNVVGAGFDMGVVEGVDENGHETRADDVMLKEGKGNPRRWV